MGIENKIYKIMFKILKRIHFFERKLTENYEEFHGEAQCNIN